MKKHKICIVGGGLTGLITAYVLREEGLDIDLIVENTKFKIFIIDHNSQRNQVESMKNLLEKSNIDYDITDLQLERFSKHIKKINQSFD